MVDGTLPALVVRPQNSCTRVPDRLFDRRRFWRLGNGSGRPQILISVDHFVRRSTQNGVVSFRQANTIGRGDGRSHTHVSDGPLQAEIDVSGSGL